MFDWAEQLSSPGEGHNISNHSSSPIMHRDTQHIKQSRPIYQFEVGGFTALIVSDRCWAICGGRGLNKTIYYPYQMHHYSAAKPELCLDLELIGTIKSSPDLTKTNECFCFVGNLDCRQASFLLSIISILLCLAVSGKAHTLIYSIHQIPQILCYLQILVGHGNSVIYSLSII